MNKNKIGIVVDSTFSANPDFLKKHHIKEVNLDIIINGKQYKDYELTNEELYTHMEKGDKVTTSQPAPSLFFNAFETLLNEGYEHIICLTVSQTLSGTVNSARLAKNMLENPDKVTVIDTRTTICGGEYVTEKLVEFSENLNTIEEVLSAIELQISKGSLVFTVDDLGILVRGGRLSKIQGMIGNLLKIKPILRFEQGKLDVEHKVRSKEQVVQYLLGEVDKLAKKTKTIVRVSYTTTQDLALHFMEEVKAAYENVSISLANSISAVVAVHVGRAGLGIYLVNE